MQREAITDAVKEAAVRAAEVPLLGVHLALELLIKVGTVIPILFAVTLVWVFANGDDTVLALMFGEKWEFDAGSEVLTKLGEILGIVAIFATWIVVWYWLVRVVFLACRAMLGWVYAVTYAETPQS